MGDMFLTVVESKPTEAEGFERRSVVIFREDLSDFLKAFQGALDFMGKGEAAKAAVSYAPADKVAPKRARTPSGFAGVGDSTAPASDAAPKRRIVVRRKNPTPKS
jgi:hypothetical protein